MCATIKSGSWKSTGRPEVVPAETKSGKRVRAAGAVLWRPDEASGQPLIGIIHRPRYDDWSLPKGKLDAGEIEPVAAVREIFEETGQLAILGRRLGTVSYAIEGGAKGVRYWAARAMGGEFVPGPEADAIVWLPIPEARKRLSYPLDRKMLGRFSRRPADTQTVLVVRHGTAGRKARYKRDDRLRPLDAKGRAQAESLVPQLLAFGGADLFAADKVRCVQTVEPFADKIGVPITVEPALTAEAYQDDPKRAHKRVLSIAAESQTPVICTQGEVIPFLIDWWCRRENVKPDKSRNRKGSTWVLSLSQGRLIAADHLPSPLAKAVSA